MKTLSVVVELEDGLWLGNGVNTDTIIYAKPFDRFEKASEHASSIRRIGKYPNARAVRVEITTTVKELTP